MANWISRSPETRGKVSKSLKISKDKKQSKGMLMVFISLFIFSLRFSLKSHIFSLTLIIFKSFSLGSGGTIKFLCCKIIQLKREETSKV